MRDYVPSNSSQTAGIERRPAPLLQVGRLDPRRGSDRKLLMTITPRLRDLVGMGKPLLPPPLTRSPLPLPNGPSCRPVPDRTLQAHFFFVRSVRPSGPDGTYGVNFWGRWKRGASFPPRTHTTNVHLALISSTSPSVVFVDPSPRQPLFPRIMAQLVSFRVGQGV